MMTMMIMTMMMMTMKMILDENYDDDNEDDDNEDYWLTHPSHRWEMILKTETLYNQL